MGFVEKMTRIVVAHHPCVPNKDIKGMVVFVQHQQYFEARGDGRLPHTIFDNQLVAQLRIWRQNKEEIVLWGVFKELIYNGRLGKRLAKMALECPNSAQQQQRNTYLLRTSLAPDPSTQYM